MGSRQAQLSIKESINLITDLIQHHYRHVTIVLDALDECYEKSRADLFILLARLACTQEAVVKVLISSRNEVDIMDQFGRSANLYIDADDNAEDICKYVNREIDNRLLHGKARLAIRLQAKEALNRKAQGMFRWAALQVESLCDPEYVHSEEDVSELLRTIPETLEATYTEILAKFQRYQTFSREAILNGLKLLMCAEYPMRITEVLGAVTILSGTGCTKFDEDDFIRMAHSLIVVDRQSKSFRFAHLSVREYLEGHPDFSAESTHAVAAEACLKVFIDDKDSDVALRAERLEGATNVLDIVRGYFHSYALTHLGRHCKKSGAKRHQGQLQRMLSYFLVDEQGRSAFRQWNRDCFQTDLETAPGTCQERRNCSSRPAQPLFMACVYGFDDIAERIVTRDNSALNAENFLRNNPLEVAATYGTYSTFTKVYNLAVTAQKSCIRPTELLSAAAGSIPAILRFLLDQDINIPSYASVLLAGARNQEYGEEMVQLVLQKAGNVDEVILEGIFRSSSSIAAIDLLLSHLGPFDITESMFLAAAKNVHIGRELMEMFKSRCQDVKITEECFISAAIGDKDVDGAESIELLLRHPKRCNITEEILESVARWGNAQSSRSLELLLAQYEPLEITEDLLAAAASNIYGGPTILHLLLERSKSPNITQQVLQKAVLKDTLNILLAHPCCPDIAEETVYIMIKTLSGQQDVVRFVFERSEKFQITEALMRTVASNREARDMAYLLSQSRAYPVSEATITAAVSNWHDGTHMTQLLLQNARDLQFEPSEDILLAAMNNGPSALGLITFFAKTFQSLPVTENVIKAAIKNYRDGKRLMDLLFSGSFGPVNVTTGILEAAAEQDDIEVIQFLLQHKGEIEISESILKSAVRPFATNNGVLKILLSQPNRPSITEVVLEAAAKRGSLSSMELLFAQPDAPKPTSKMLTLAASNLHRGEEVVDYLLSASECLITEDSLIAAAGNIYSGLSVMRLLLSQPESRSLITEKVLQTAISNGSQGQEFVQLLLSQPDRNMKVTVETLKLAVSKAAETSEYSLGPVSSVLRLLLAHSTQLMSEPESLLEAAAERRDGKWIVQLLLSHFEDIPITQKALKVAAGNAKAGTSIMKVFLNRPGVSVSLDVFRTAASNKYQGTQMMQLLLAHSSDSIELSEEVRMVALGNSVCGRSLLELLLVRSQNFNITSGIIEAASRNDVFGTILLLRLLKEAITNAYEQPVPELVQKLKEGPNGLRDALFISICEGDEQVLKFFLEHDADVTAQAGELGTTLDVAVYAGNLRAVELLLDHGANVHSRSSLRGSTLEVACERGHFEIVRCLIDHGADINQIDSMGRSLLHRALRQDQMDLINFLLSIGASATMIDHQKLSPMHHAVCGNSDHGIKRLLELGISLEEEDFLGWTPLHWAARSGNMTAAEKLLEAGASKMKTDSEGRAAYRIAAICGHRHLQALLWIPDISDLDADCRPARSNGTWCDACDLVVSTIKDN